MKCLLLSLLLLLPLAGSAQSAAVADFFERYSASEEVTSVRIEPPMMRLMSRQAAERGDKELSKLLTEILYIRILSLKTDEEAPLVREARELMATDRKFRLVTSATEEGQTTQFYLRESRLTNLSEFVMISSGPRETVVVDIFGAFDLQQVARLSTLRPGK